MSPRFLMMTALPEPGLGMLRDVGEVVAVDFVERLRGMVAFSSVEALVEQMKGDVDRARELLT